MTTLDVDSLRIELMRDILDTEDIDVLKTVKRTLTRALAKVKERQVAAGITLPGSWASQRPPCISTIPASRKFWTVSVRG